MVNEIVSTIGQKCKRCYSCVRECPAIAIRVENGQAVVIQERCISCGHCVKVCSQNAKQIYCDTERLLKEIIPNYETYAIVAPSFAASFGEYYKKLPAALRRMGFSKIIETAFGADLISSSYEKIIDQIDKEVIISSPCPAIYNYIEKYFTELVPNLAKVVSPMIALGKYLKDNYGNNIKIVFIGPCVAKKSEYTDNDVAGNVDAVLTFTELKDVFESLNICLAELENSTFDPPYSFMGKSYPLPGGLLKTAQISSDVLDKKIIVVEGKDKVQEIIEDISSGKIKSKFIDILFCEGCISGPAIDTGLNYYSRREKIINYIDESIHQCDKNVWKSELFNSRGMNFSRQFTAKSQRRPMPTDEKIKEILARTKKYDVSDELNCGACGYKTCREYAVAIGKGLAEEEMCLPFLIEELEDAYRELKLTQEQLHSAEKLASIGQLAAGIAHEINNPLGTILLYSSMLKKGIEKCKSAKSISDDLSLIISETNRCRDIVSNLLNFARQGKLKITLFQLQNIINEILRPIKHNPNNKILVNTIDEINGLMIEGDADQLKQVLINIISNSCEAMEETNKKYLTIKTVKNGNNVVIEISDTGCGIPAENISKLFTPFFTTKKIGKGTGLGLAISYGIIKMHRGDIRIESQKEEGSKVIITIPVKNKSMQAIMN